MKLRQDSYYQYAPVYALTYALTICALLLFASPSWAGATYYVDATLGNDTYDGLSEAAAWQTVAKVNAATFLSSGDSVLFKCGETWREPLTVPASGAAGEPIVFGQYGDCDGTNRPVFSAAEIITGWSSHSGSIYVASVSFPVLQVFVDGEFVNLAHHPNKGYLPDKPESVYLNIAADSMQTANGKCVGNDQGSAFLTTGADLSVPSGESLVGAGLHIRSILWRIEDRVATGHDPGAQTIHWQSETDFHICKGWGYYLDNKLWMLDEPGEWYYENGLLYVWLPDGTDPSFHQIEATRHANGVTATEKNHFAIRDIAIRHAGSEGVRLANANGPELSRLEVSDSGGVGILLTAYGGVPIDDAGTINECTVRNSVHEGINGASVSGLIITNSQVENSGTVGTPRNSLAAIRAGRSSQIVNNRITNSGYIGIRFADNSVVALNVIDNACLVLDDCGAIYSWNKDTPELVYNTQVVDNIVKGAFGNIDGTPSKSRLSMGIYLDEGTNGVEAGRNTISETRRGIFLNNAFANSVHENTVYGNNEYQLYFNENATAPGSAANNAVSGNTVFPISGVGQGSASHSTSPSVGLNSAFDTINFGFFDHQLYSGLYSGTIVSESSRPPFSSGTSLIARQYYDLEKWQNQKAQDPNGRTFEPFGIASHKSVQVLQSISVPNATFDTGISSWFGFPEPISWVSDCGLDGGCVSVQASSTQKTSANSGIFALNAGTLYRLRLSAIAPVNDQTGRVLVKIDATKTSVGLDMALTAGTNRREYRFVFPATATLGNAKIDLEVNSGNSIYFDNVRLEEITAEINDPGDDSHLLTNATDAGQLMLCPDADTDASRCAEYIDLDGSPVIWNTDQVLLWPYGSKIIVWANNPFVDGDRDGIADSDDACPQTDTPFAVDDSGCSAYQLAAADLSLSVSATPASVQVGDTVTYTLTVTNAGPGAASAVSVTGSLPDGCTFASIASGGSDSCTLTDIASAAGTLSHAMTVAAAESDPNLADNSATASTTVTATPADLGLTVLASPDTVQVGDTVTYTLTVTNAGPGAASAVSVTGSLPDGCTFASIASGGSDSCTLTDIASTAGTLTHSMTVAAAESDPNLADNSATASTTVEAPAADLGLTVSATPASVQVGDTVTYTLTVTNAGPGSASAVTVTGTLPDGCTFASIASGGSDSCVLTDIASTAGTLTHTMTVAAAESDPNLADNSATASTTVEALAADLGLSLSASPASVQVGDTVTYTLTVTNAGPGAASAVTVSGTLPDGCTFASIASGGSDSCVLTDIASAAGTLTHTMTVAAAESDPNLADNSATASTTVEALAADLGLSLSASPASVQVGDTVTYTFTVTNAGPGPASAVTVTGTLPDGCTFASIASGGSDSCTLTNIASTAGTLTHTMTVAAAESDPNLADNSATASTTVEAPAADLGLTVSATPASVQVGDTVTYTLTVTNAGPGAASAVTVTGTLPDGCTFASIASGGSDSCTLTDIASTAGTLTHSMTVAAAESDPNLADNSATASTTVEALAADLGLSLSASPASVQVGDTVTYTLTVTNAGPGAASAVTVSGTLPDGCTFASIASGGSDSCTLTDIASTAGTLTHTMTVAAAESDPNLADNSATASTTVEALAADLGLSLSASPASVQVGDTVTYTFTVTNAGPGPASAVTVTGTLPDGCTFASIASGGSDSCTLTDIASTAGTLTHTMTVAAAESDPNLADNSATASTTVEALAADLGLSLSASPASVQVGDTVTYTLTVTNAGPGAASAVTVSGTLPDGCTFASIASGGSDSCTLSDIASTTGTLTHTMTVAAAESDPNLADNSATASTTVEALAADLGLTVSATPASVQVGDTVTYTLTVTNAGPGPASAVTVTGTLPDGCTFASIASGGSDSCTLTDIASTAGTLTHSMTVAAAESDPNLADNSATASTTVEALAADLGLSLSASPASVQVGDTVTYTLTVTNAGPAAASAVTVTGTLPECTFASITSGASTSCVRTAIASAAGTLTHTMAVAAAESDPNLADNSASSSITVQTATAADLSLSLTATPSTVLIGDTITYTLRVTNTGPAAASTVTVSGTLPRCTFKTIASGASKTCVKTVTATTAGTLSQTMTVSAKEYDPNTVNNTATSSTTVSPGCAAASGYILRGALTKGTGSALSGATLTLQGPNGCANRTLSDSAGKYKFAGLPNGSYVITPSKAGCSAFSPTSRSWTLQGADKSALNFWGKCP